MLRRELLIGTLVLGVASGAGGGEMIMVRTTKTVLNGDVALATEATGEAVRGTILLVMGATASMVWWPNSLVDALARGGYRVIRFDHRDTGRSSTGSPDEVGYDVNDLAGDLMAILDAYGVERAHLVGMSLGAYVSQIASLQHRDRVQSLALIAAEPLGVTYEGEGVAPELLAHFGGMAGIDWSDRGAVAAFMLEIARLSAGAGRVFGAEAAKARIAMELDRASNMQSAFNHSIVAGELDPGLTAAAIRQPVVVIHGSDDPIIAVGAAIRSAEIIRGARLLVLEGTGHELVEADVPAIAEAVLANCERAS